MITSSQYEGDELCIVQIKSLFTFLYRNLNRLHDLDRNMNWQVIQYYTMCIVCKTGRPNYW